MPGRRMAGPILCTERPCVAQRVLTATIEQKPTAKSDRALCRPGPQTSQHDVDRLTAHYPQLFLTASSHRDFNLWRIIYTNPGRRNGRFFMKQLVHHACDHYRTTASGERNIASLGSTPPEYYVTGFDVGGEWRIGKRSSAIPEKLSACRQ